jgi:hypothetical protein
VTLGFQQENAFMNNSSRNKIFIICSRINVSGLGPKIGHFKEINMSLFSLRETAIQSK